MTTNQPKKKLQRCLDSDYLNKWTLAIFTLILLMATSVALAICFPYQGADSYLRVTDDNSAAMEETVVVEEGSTTVMVKDTAVVVDSSIGTGGKMSNEKSHQNVEMTSTAGGVVSSPPLQTLDVAEGAPSTAEDGGVDNGGLFGPSATATDEQQPDEQADVTTGISDGENSSCQMKLQQADTNMDKIIDASEYITFLQNIGNIPLSTTQLFDELPSEYQVNFDHLATAPTAVVGLDNNVVGGIPIGTMEEMQKVCVYISKKGSSAVGEFDWNQIISSSP